MAFCAPLWPQARDQVELEMRNVNFHVDQSVTLEVRHLRGRMIATRPGEPPIFDDRNSFLTHVDWAEIAISAQSMTDLLNRYVFAYEGTPIKNVTLAIDHGRVKEKGTMHKAIDLPFEVEGALAATPDGEIRLHADKIRSAHVPFKGLLHLFGEDLSKLINLKADLGVRVVGDDILLSPARIIPAPRFEGKVTAVRIEQDRIVQVFGSQNLAKPLAPPYQARNYIYHRGGTLRFGKLTMTDTDLEIVDKSPRDPFDFNLAEYNRQLVAGYSKNTPSHGLIVFMPDYFSLSRR